MKTQNMLFPDPSSLGYAIQGISLIDSFKDVTLPGSRLFVETDAQLVPLFQRSYQYDSVEFVATDHTQRAPLPNNGRPQNEDEMAAYFTANAQHLANRLGLGDDYVWARLLRPEIAPPFAAKLPLTTVPAPYPEYLIADKQAVSSWTNDVIGDRVPVLISWNKGFSQHGDAAQQNLDADDVAFIIREIAKDSDVRLSFYNAVHDISAADYAAVNNQLDGDLRLMPIPDPKTGTDFNLRTEIDRYAAFMSAAKLKTGIMLGVGNTCQHLWHAIYAYDALDTDQIVVLPHGDFPTKATWQLQEVQMGSPTVTVSKSADFASNRETTRREIVAHARRALNI